MILQIIAVAVGAAIGALLRFAAGNWVNDNYPRHFYLATLAVNIAGCLMIGVFYGVFLLRRDVPIEVRSGIMVGFFGGLTTFSSFSLDTVRLLEDHKVPQAIGYTVGSVFGGLLATWVGLTLTKL